MTYLQCLPDPAIVTKEDCEKIHEIIGRLSLNGKIKIDAVPSNFKQYSAPENHRKYFFYMRPEREGWKTDETGGGESGQPGGTDRGTS